MSDQHCSVCGSIASVPYSKPVDYISGERFSVLCCQRCGLIYVYPQPEPVDIHRYYPEGHQQADPASYEKMDAKARVDFVEHSVPTKLGRALDVGCGKGLFLLGLRERGWQVFGTELSEVSCRYARDKQLSVFTSSVEDARFDAESFDLITLFHVLEHLPRPQDTLSTLFSLLRPGGILIAEVPNIGSWYAKVFGDNWFHYDVPRHLFHFTPRTLSQIVADVGFEITQLGTRNLQYDAFGFVQSLLNSMLKKTNLLNNFNTKQVTISDLWADDRRISNLLALAASELVLSIGFPTMVFVGLAISPWVDGGTLRILGRKPG